MFFFGLKSVDLFLSITYAENYNVVIRQPALNFTWRYLHNKSNFCRDVKFLRYYFFQRNIFFCWGARGFFFGRHAFNEVTAKAAVIGSTLYIIKTTRVSNIRFADDFILHHVWSLDEVHGGCRLNSSLGVEWINVPRTNWYKNKVETAALEKTCEEEMKFLEFINHQID